MSESKSIRPLTENLYLGFTIEELEERLEMQGGPMADDGCTTEGPCNYCHECAHLGCVGILPPWH